MTFKEYVKQQDPKRHPEVIIKKEDCYGYYPGNDLPQTRAIIVLEIHHEFYSYLLLKESNKLWTMDEDGNPKNRSCFNFKEE